MINDPLLHRSESPTHNSPNWAPPTIESVPSVPRTPVTTTIPPGRRTVASRRRHPAVSSRILAVGISTSAMFAMTAAYASAERTNSPQPVNDQSATRVLPTQQGTSNRGAGTAARQATPQQATPQQGAPQQAAPHQASPNVVQVPVDPVAPALPGNNGGNPQQSSGSH